MSENKTNYAPGDDVFYVDVRLGTATMKGSPILFENKIEKNMFGRIGHTKEQAIDNAIEMLLRLKNE